MSDLIVIQKLEHIEKMLSEQTLLKKEVLNFHETAMYLEVSHSHLYKLTSSGTVPFSKPNGKKLYFNRKELNTWLMSNKHLSADEIEAKASNYVALNRKRG